MKITKADKWFSMFIRLRDADENGIAECCTCSTRKHIKQMDCGHFIKRQHQATRFNESNCATQCKHCNCFEQGRDDVFEWYLIKKYGQDKVDLLKASKRSVHKRTKFDMEYLTTYYKQKATELSKEKGIPLW